MNSDTNGYFGIQQGVTTLACSIVSLCAGLTSGFSAVLPNQLLEDKSFPYDEQYNSWIASISPLSMCIGCLCSGPILDAYGRKTSSIILSFPFIAGWLISAFALNGPMLLASRFFTGLCSGAVRPVTMIYIGEITDPLYRAMALVSPSFGINIGVLISHVIVTFLYWRWSSLVCSIPSIISLIMFLFLLESPTWLISKGQTEIGINNFNKLRGTGHAAKDELKVLLVKHAKEPTRLSLKETLNILSSPNFLKPYATTFVLFLSVQFSGVNVMPFYAKDIMETTFSAQIDTFLLMMVIDSILVLPSIFICFIGRRLSRKITFLTCSFGTAISLFVLVILLYLDFVWLPVVFLIIYIALAVITVSISWSLLGEIFPTSIRGLGSSISSGTSHLILFAVVLMTPSIMTTFDEKILFISYGSVVLVCSVILCFILPETNGKSLNDIEKSYLNHTNENITRL